MSKADYKNQIAISGYSRRQSGPTLLELQGLMATGEGNTDCDDDDEIMEQTQESDLIHSKDTNRTIHNDEECSDLTYGESKEITTTFVAEDNGLTARDVDKDSCTNEWPDSITDNESYINNSQSMNEPSELGIRFQNKKEHDPLRTKEADSNKENCQNEDTVELDLADTQSSPAFREPLSVSLDIRNTGDNSDVTSTDRDGMEQSVSIDLSDCIESTQDSQERDIYDLEGDTCRICHCGNETETLISPCSCTGTVKYIHHSCLMDWLKRCVKTKCELCLQNFSVHRKTKPLKKWRRPDQKPTPIIWLLTFVVALTLNIASIAKDGSQKCVSNPCIIFYVVGALGAMLGFAFFYHWLLVSIRYMKQWMALNEEWTLVGCDNRVLGNENLAASNKSVDTKDQRNQVV